MSITAQAEVDVAKMITLIQSIKEGTIEGLNIAGDHIIDLASQLAPEDTGELKLSGGKQVVGDTLTVSFGNGLPDDRAIAQEYGTIFMPPQPYLGPAVANIDIVQDMADAIISKLNK
jgi:hypothetical protein